MIARASDLQSIALSQQRAREAEQRAKEAEERAAGLERRRARRSELALQRRRVPVWLEIYAAAASGSASVAIKNLPQLDREHFEGIGFEVIEKYLRRRHAPAVCRELERVRQRATDCAGKIHEQGGRFEKIDLTELRHWLRVNYETASAFDVGQWLNPESVRVHLRSREDFVELTDKVNQAAIRADRFIKRRQALIELLNLCRGFVRQADEIEEQVRGLQYELRELEKELTALEQDPNSLTDKSVNSIHEIRWDGPQRTIADNAEYGFSIHQVRYLFFDGCAVIDRITAHAKLAAERGLAQDHYLVSEPDLLSGPDGKLLALTNGLKSLGFAVDPLLKTNEGFKLAISW